MQMQRVYNIIVDESEVLECGNLSWSDDIDTITCEFSFESTSPIATGSKIMIANTTTGMEVLRGIITNRKTLKNKKYQYSGFDYGFYLNKNEVIIQFNNVKIDLAIKQLCQKVNVPVGNICSINAYVSKIFKDVVVSDIINELLELASKKTGSKYVFSCQNGKLEIVDTKTECEAEIELANGVSINIADSLSNIDYEESIQDLKNSIQLVDSNEKSKFVVASAKDDKSISEFGLLNQVETIDKDDKTSKNVIASNLLKDLNKIKRTLTVDLLGVDDFKKGSILSLEYPEYEVSGKFYAKTTNHSVKNRIHYCSAEMVKIDD
jgi:hypothetical protein